MPQHPRSPTTLAGTAALATVLATTSFTALACGYHDDVTLARGIMNWVYRTNESSQDRIYYQRYGVSGRWAGAFSGETLVAASANGGAAGAVFTGIDL